jgi:hypothetical protein
MSYSEFTVINPALLSNQLHVPQWQQKLHPTSCNLGAADKLVLELSRWVLCKLLVFVQEG